jgi:hypothetical protein
MKVWQKLAIAGLMLGVSGIPATTLAATLGEIITNQTTTIVQTTRVVNTSSLTRESLFNAEYQVPDYGKFRLVNGQYIYKTGAAQKTSIKLETYTAIVDLNKDGAKDAVVVLSVSPGASHNYKFLAVAINQQGSPVNIDTLYLGDRIKVKKIVLQASGELLVHMLNRDESGIRVDKFKLQGGRLVKM